MLLQAHRKMHMVSEVRRAHHRPSLYHLVCPVLRDFFVVCCCCILPDSGPGHRHIMNYGERLNRMAFCEFCVRRKWSELRFCVHLTKAKMTMLCSAPHIPPHCVCFVAKELQLERKYGYGAIVTRNRSTRLTNPGARWNSVKMFHLNIMKNVACDHST